MVILRNLYFTGTGSGPGTPLYSETSDKGHSAKEDKPPNKGQAESTLVYTLYKKKITSERGQPLNKGQNSCMVLKVSLLRVSQLYKGQWNL